MYPYFSSSRSLSQITCEVQRQHSKLYLARNRAEEPTNNMTSKINEVIGHLPSLLPDGPEEGPFTDTNWTTLLAIMDTVIPSISREKSGTSTNSEIDHRTISDEEYQTTVTYLKENVFDPPKDSDLDGFLAERASEIPAFQELLKRSLVFYASEDSRKGLAFILSALKYIPQVIYPSQNILCFSSKLTMAQHNPRIPPPHRLHNTIPPPTHPHPRRNPRAMAPLLPPPLEPSLQIPDRHRQKPLAENQPDLPKSRWLPGYPAPRQAGVKSRVRLSTIRRSERTSDRRDRRSNYRLWMRRCSLCQEPR